jgi:hypothetical protein
MEYRIISYLKATKYQLQSFNKNQTFIQKIKFSNTNTLAKQFNFNNINILEILKQFDSAL